MSIKKQYKVTIFGDQYTLVSDESEGHILQAAALIDKLMKEVAEKMKSSDSKKISVIVALRLASTTLNLESELDAQRVHREKLIGRIEQELLSL